MLPYLYISRLFWGGIYMIFFEVRGLIISYNVDGHGNDADAGTRALEVM